MYGGAQGACTRERLLAENRNYTRSRNVHFYWWNRMKTETCDRSDEHQKRVSEIKATQIGLFNGDTTSSFGEFIQTLGALNHVLPKTEGLQLAAAHSALYGTPNWGGIVACLWQKSASILWAGEGHQGWDLETSPHQILPPAHIPTPSGLDLNQLHSRVPQGIHSVEKLFKSKKTAMERQQLQLFSENFANYTEANWRPRKNRLPEIHEGPRELDAKVLESLVVLWWEGGGCSLQAQFGGVTGWGEAPSHRKNSLWNPIEITW